VDSSEIGRESETPGEDEPVFRYSQALDRPVIRDVFKRFRRVHVPDFLSPESARRLHACLVNDVPWSLAYFDGEKAADVNAGENAALGHAERRDLEDKIAAQAHRGFAYIYESFRVDDEAARKLYPNLYLQRFVDYLNSAEFLSFIRAVTGLSRIAFADAQATRYRSGHFLTRHDDDVAGKNRLAAYVLNLTPDWRADYGGNLLFLGPDGHVEEAYVPRFNALNIFAVPKGHAVSIVAPFAKNARYSVTGWLRAR